MELNFQEIASQFAYDGDFIDAVSYGSGHINDTYAASFDLHDGKTHRYILQRINQRVFREPEKLMENIDGITRHLRKKIVFTGGNPDRETLNIVPTIHGKTFILTEKGEYWRSYIFIENAHTYDVVDSRSHFYNGGKAFGKFQELLSDFPVDKLNETIPDFHNTKKRYTAFLKAVEQDTVNRAANVRREIDFVVKRAADTAILVDLLEAGKLPLRVTHNDTKFNNVMIDDSTGDGICVIDLDTVMPGLTLYDFGDAIRSGTNPAAEDEKDLSKVWMELKLFESFTRGYLESTRDFLTPVELEYLPFSAKLMTFECGMRFLTDHLNGDTYFKVHRKEHNLDRARTQFRMVADMEAKMEQMKDIVKKYSRDC